MCLFSLVVEPILTDVARADGPQTAAAATNAATAPTVYWGAFVRGWPEDPSSIDQLESTVGKHMSIVHWGEPWAENGQPQQFQSVYFDLVRQRGSIPLLDWGSQDTSGDMTEQPDFQLAAITRGDWDAYITSWAQAATAWGHPLFLRFDPEMNGWWLPWSEQVNGNSAGEFVPAWRHVHDIFVQQGATNVTWVWCPNIVSPASTPTGSLYPGDNYVDWTCADGYNWGTDNANAWQSFSQVFGGDPRYGGHNTYQELIDVAPSKPIMIGETASSEHGGSKAAWIRDMLQTQLPVNYPQVRALVWFEPDGGDPAVTWNVKSSNAAAREFTQGIGLPVYAGSAYSSLQTSPIPPPDALVP
jgi:hypothetical protein